MAAVIEDARRRARRRRAAYAAALALILLLGAILAGTLAWSGGRKVSVVSAPPGSVVKAQGPVAHAVVEQTTAFNNPASVSVATGRARPSRSTEEIWYDTRSGLWRDVLRVDGRKRSEAIGTACETPCRSLPTFAYLGGFPWSQGVPGLHPAGTGTFRGQEVTWLESRGTPVRLPHSESTSTIRVGIDPSTHRTVVQRSYIDGRLAGQLAVSWRPDLPAKSVSFVVPQRGTTASPPHSRQGRSNGLTLGYGLPATRTELGRAPLWLGPRFRGFALGSASVGRYSPGPNTGQRLHTAKYVRFDYGYDVDRGGYAFSVEEFGAIRPDFLQHGPRPGTVEQDGTSFASLSRDGLVLRVTSDFSRFPMTRANAIALARALRRLPPNVNTLPTLRQE